MKTHNIEFMGQTVEGWKIVCRLYLLEHKEAPRSMSDLYYYWHKVQVEMAPEHFVSKALDIVSSRDDGASTNIVRDFILKTMRDRA